MEDRVVVRVVGEVDQLALVASFSVTVPDCLPRSGPRVRLRRLTAWVFEPVLVSVTAQLFDVPGKPA